MSATELIGRKVHLVISDPWEFGTDCGVGPFRAQVVTIDQERISVQLEHPINYSNANYNSAVCQVRHEGTSTDDLRGTTRLPVNIMLLPKSATSLIELDQEITNEGFAAIGTIELS